MKKFLILSAFLFWPLKPAQAIQTTVWSSSNTAVQQSTTALCGQYFYVGGSTQALHGILHGICINTAAAGNVQVFASSFTGLGTATITGSYSTATQAPCNFYDTVSGTGLSFNKNGTADISILYQCY
jgi:hypothetical protein